VLHAAARAGEKHPLEPPVGKVQKRLSLGGIVGKGILKGAALGQKGFDPAKRAGEQPVGFLQLGRPPALGTLMFDQEVDGRRFLA
jgi:hypothetical protein